MAASAISASLISRYGLADDLANTAANLTRNPRRDCLIIGHRGARGLFAENTLDGFHCSAALGVDAIELDVGLTADGAVVVHHDPRLNPALTRGPDGQYQRGAGAALNSLRLAELARYDIGRIDPTSRYAAAYPAQRGMDGATIPTLAAVLAAQPDMHFVIELKSSSDPDPAWPDPIALADATTRVCDTAGDPARYVLQSFDPRPLRHLRDHRPDLVLAWLTLSSRAGAAASVAAEGATTWSPLHDGLTQTTIVDARALGLRVVPWTVNDAERIEALIAAGVDGLITDRPDLALAVRDQPPDR